MADVGSHHFVKGARISSPAQRLNDTNALQNWSTKWKTLAIISATFATFMEGFGPLSLAPTFPYLMEAFDSDLTGVVRFVGVAILVLGFSNFIWFVSHCHICFKYADECHQGPDQYSLRSPRCLHYLSAHLLWIVYLARKGSDI